MKYELKIALPMYKIIYSMLFMVIIILVRPIMSYNEIVSVLESSVALLAGVFMADIYYMEYMNERISTYSLFPIKQKRGSILKRAFISQLYLIVLVAVFYWGFVLVYHPTNYSGVPVISLYASCMGACAASMFFMGTFCFTATNLMRNIGLAIGLLFFFWLLLTSTIIRVLCSSLTLPFSGSLWIKFISPRFTRRTTTSRALRSEKLRLSITSLVHLILRKQGSNPKQPKKKRKPA